MSNVFREVSFSLLDQKITMWYHAIILYQEDKPRRSSRSTWSMSRAWHSYDVRTCTYMYMYGVAALFRTDKIHGKASWKSISYEMPQALMQPENHTSHVPPPIPPDGTLCKQHNYCIYLTSCIATSQLPLALVCIHWWCSCLALLAPIPEFRVQHYCACLVGDNAKIAIEPHRICRAQTAVATCWRYHSDSLRRLIN